MIDQWIKDMWAKNKVLFFVLLIPILLVIFRNVLIDLLIKGAHDKVDETKAKDEQLAKEADEANKKADQLVDHAKRLDETKKPIGEDWHKNE